MLDLDNVVRLIAITNDEMEGEIVRYLRDDAKIYHDSPDAKLLEELANAIEKK